jgi:bacterioferritin (cytochrome b1)
MNKNEYLEEKIEFYRQEIERYKTMILHEKEDTVSKEFLEDELEAAEEMFEMFVNINTQVIA